MPIDRAGQRVDPEAARQPDAARVDAQPARSGQATAFPGIARAALLL